MVEGFEFQAVGFMGRRGGMKFLEEETKSHKKRFFRRGARSDKNAAAY